MRKRIGSFTAYTDKGEPVELDIYQDIVSTSTQGNPNAVVGGQKRIVTRDGKSVNNLKDEGKYQIVQTEEILTSDAPEAP